MVYYALYLELRLLVLLRLCVLRAVPRCWALRKATLPLVCRDALRRVVAKLVVFVVKPRLCLLRHWLLDLVRVLVSLLRCVLLGVLSLLWFLLVVNIVCELWCALRVLQFLLRRRFLRALSFPSCLRRLLLWLLLRFSVVRHELTLSEAQPLAVLVIIAYGLGLQVFPEHLELVVQNHSEPPRRQGVEGRIYLLVTRPCLQQKRGKVVLVYPACNLSRIRCVPRVERRILREKALVLGRLLRDDALC